MPSSLIVTNIKVYSKTKSEWETDNPIIYEGEAAFCTDTREMAHGQNKPFKDTTLNVYIDYVGPHDHTTATSNTPGMVKLFSGNLSSSLTNDTDPITPKNLTSIIATEAEALAAVTIS